MQNRGKCLLDPQLRPVANIPVGYWPRDIKIDRVRGWVFVGNYVDGTISVIDLNAKKVLATLRPARGPDDRSWTRSLVMQLSGLFVDDHENLYVADGMGIFRIDAAQIDQLVKR
jgi:DNA-binding beta-propeller fold protein YncE